VRVVDFASVMEQHANRRVASKGERERECFGIQSPDATNSSMMACIARVSSLASGLA